MSLPIEFQNDQFNITETPTGITIAIGRALTAFPEVQESIRQLMMVALKFMLTEDLERERRQDAEDSASDIRDAVRREMDERETGEHETESGSDAEIDDATVEGEIGREVVEPPGSDVDERDDRE